LKWHELKVCIRRKVFPPSYEKNKNHRKEMEELVEKGKKIIEREFFLIRDKEFREKVQDLIKKTRGE